MSKNSDMAEIFNALKEENKEIRQRRYDENMKILNESDIPFKMLSPYHVRIDDKIDFWPSTNKWRVLKSGKMGTGILNVEKYL
jgi:hypothetical protein